MTTPPFDPVALALRIRVLVETTGTVNEAATQCGLPKPSLESYIYRQTCPNALALARICKGFEVSADWLLFGETRT